MLPLGCGAALGFCVLLAAGSTAAHGQAHADTHVAQARGAAPASVQDLAYGEVLFHFFQDEHFEALTRLLAAQARGELDAHAEDAELLLGGLYLSYGQHRLAGRIFEQVLERYEDAPTRDRAWFFLARIRHQRGYLDEAEDALLRIRDELPAGLESERRMLHAQVLLEQQRFDEALARLEDWRRPDDAWVGYARYNIGVALVRLGRVEEGAAVLESLGRSDLRDPEYDALRDRANVALGYAWLQAAQPAAAKPSLQRVRLQGPYSNKALLAVGWADAADARYESALAPWLELSQRPVLDSAVQESLLAVPYAFAELGADAQAAEHYQDAIDAFEREIQRLDEVIASIGDGRLVAELLRGHRTDGSGWYWELDDIPRSFLSAYVYDLVSTHRFQEALKSYRDLQYLTENFDRWAESLSAFDDILDTRERAYRERLPVIEASLASVDLDALARRRVELEARLVSIERSEDVVALGTPNEQQTWGDLADVEADLALLPDDARARELRDKHRFLRGLLLWDLRRDFKVRLWSGKRELAELDGRLAEARERRHAVTTARDEWPAEFAELTQRIGGLEPRVQALQARARAALERQRRFLRDIAAEELTARRARIATYRVQARFALAALYDRAAAAPAASGDGTAAAGEGGADEPSSDASIAAERR